MRETKTQIETRVSTTADEMNDLAVAAVSSSELSSQTMAGSTVVSTSSVASTMAYNEMADVPVQIIDPVEQVEKNLAHLQELQSRMKFMMREIRYLMKI